MTNANDDIVSVSLKSSRWNNVNNVTTISGQSMILTDQLRDRLTLSSYSRTPERKTLGYQPDSLQYNSATAQSNLEIAAMHQVGGEDRQQKR